MPASLSPEPRRGRSRSYSPDKRRSPSPEPRGRSPSPAPRGRSPPRRRSLSRSRSPRRRSFSRSPPPRRGSRSPRRYSRSPRRDSRDDYRRDDYRRDDYRRDDYSRRDDYRRDDYRRDYRRRDDYRRDDYRRDDYRRDDYRRRDDYGRGRGMGGYTRSGDRDREQAPKSAVLGVFNLSMYTTEDSLRDLFGKYGPLKTVAIITDRNTQRSRGFGFITFEDEDDAEAAKDKMNGAEVDERTLRVDFSHTKKAHAPTPGMYIGRVQERDRDRLREELTQKPRESRDRD